MPKAHIVIGGPLDGEFATSADFHGGYEKVDGRNDYSQRVEGMYEHLAREYQQFNTAYRRSTLKGANVVWIHESLLRPPISPRLR